MSAARTTLGVRGARVCLFGILLVMPWGSIFFFFVVLAICDDAMSTFLFLGSGIMSRRCVSAVCTTLLSAGGASFLFDVSFS